MIRLKTVHASLIMLLFLSGCGIDRGGIDIMDPPVDPVDPVRPLVLAGVLEKHESLPDLYYVGDGVARTLIDVGRDVVIRINGEIAMPDDLQEGMYVRTYRAQANPTFMDIDFNVAGGEPTENPVSMRPSVFGVDVLTTDSELETMIAELTDNPSSDIAISGYTTTNQDIDATAVLAYPAGNSPLITGIARDVDTVNFRFNLGGQTIDYSQAGVIDTESGSVEELSRLRVVLDSSILPNELSAMSITQVHTLGPQRFLDTDVNLVNYVSEVIDPDQFRIGDIVFWTSDQTVFDNVVNNRVTTESLVSMYGLIDTDDRVFVWRLEQLN